MARAQGDDAGSERRPGATAGLMRLAAACTVLAAVAFPSLAGEYRDSTSMKDMTVLECTGQGRWARGPMEARELYAIDTANNDVLLYNAQSMSFASICQGAGCAIGIDGANYSVSRDGGDTVYSLNISRSTGAWEESQVTPSDRQAFIRKQGVCKSRKNPLGKAAKPKF